MRRESTSNVFSRSASQPNSSPGTPGTVPARVADVEPVEQLVDDDLDRDQTIELGHFGKSVPLELGGSPMDHFRQIVAESFAGRVVGFDAIFMIGLHFLWMCNSCWRVSPGIDQLFVLLDVGEP